MWKVWLQAAVLSLVALFSAWLLSLLERSPDVEEQELNHDPDFYMEGFTTVRMGDDGKPRHELSARRMQHFPDTDTHELTELTLLLHDGSGEPPWQIDAEHGWVSEAQQEILLSGAVQIQRPGQGGQPELAVEARDMRVQLDQDYAETRSPVTIRTAAGETRSVGMQAHLKERRIELLSQVRTRYETSTKD